MNIETNCKQIFSAANGILQKYRYLPEPILCKIVFNKCLTILTYALECFQFYCAVRGV